MTRKFFVGGNFKMNGSLESLKTLLEGWFNNATMDPNVEILIAPPAIYILPLQHYLNHKQPPVIHVAAQNCYSVPSGAFTGEVSAAQLCTEGIAWVILGHSERRAIFGESDELVALKTKACIEGEKSKLSVVLCCGETLEEREAGNTMDVVKRQLEAVLKQVKDWRCLNVTMSDLERGTNTPGSSVGKSLSRMSPCGLLVPGRSPLHSRHKKSTLRFEHGLKPRFPLRRLRKPGSYMVVASAPRIARSSAKSPISMVSSSGELP
ncbi:triosephosphate isomerase [Tulasnella sp. JGI-2019a]|nr:triosephosphate isomerase [Tulasnella sp. JGI-2019a]